MTTTSSKQARQIDLGALARSGDPRIDEMVEELTAGVSGPSLEAGARWTSGFAAIGKAPPTTPPTTPGARWTAEFAAIGKTPRTAPPTPGARWTAEFAAVGKALGKTNAPGAARFEAGR